jgi:hypothetical protein
MWLSLGVAAASILLITVGAVLVLGDDEDEPEVSSAATLAAIDLAQRFMAARDAWDGETIRSLLADDATIDDFAVENTEEYLANAEMERAAGWRHLQPECTATRIGPPIGVTCEYVMENALSRALGVGPYTGSRVEFTIADGHIASVTNRFDSSVYSGQTLEPFLMWVDEAHPGDGDVMFGTTATGDLVGSTTPESIDLWQRNVTQFAALQTAVRFMQARDAWDGETLRALVADDARIADHDVVTSDQYIADARWRAATAWRFMDPQCEVVGAGTPVSVVCTYTFANALSEGFGVGPYEGSRYEFEIADGLIHDVTNNWDPGEYPGEAYEPFLVWLESNDSPGDSDVMFGEKFTQESLDLWAQYLPRWLDSLEQDRAGAAD